MRIVIRAFTYSALTFAGILLAGCGKPSGGGGGGAGSATTNSAPAPKGGSCNIEKEGICQEFSENPLGMAEGLCKDMLKGTFKKEACPAADLLGTCKEKDGDKKMYYFGNARAAWVSDAKEDCEKNPLQPGATFTAAPGAEEAAKTPEKAIPAASKISGSCADPDGTQCEDHFGSMTDLDKDMCTQSGHKWATTACPADELAGSCLGRGKVTRYYKKMTKITKASAMQKFCEDASILGANHWYPAPGFDAKAAAPAGKAAAPAAKAKK
jgi:hypothetical protein